VRLDGSLDEDWWNEHGATSAGLLGLDQKLPRASYRYGDESVAEENPLKGFSVAEDEEHVSV